MSASIERDRILALIQRLDHAYAKGMISPDEYGALRRGLELRLPPLKRPSKKLKYFRLKVAMVAVIAVMVLVAVPLTLVSSRPSFQISDVKFEQDTLSMSIKNTGTSEAHDVVIELFHSKGRVDIQILDIIKPLESVSVNKQLYLGPSWEQYGEFNIIVSCREGILLRHSFKP